jgi:flagellar biosynthesis protein FliR
MTKQQRLLQCIVLSALCCIPALYMVDWQSASYNYGAYVRLWLFAGGGLLMLSWVMLSAIQWIAARAAGNRSYSFVACLEQYVVPLILGCIGVLVAAAWQFFGAVTPA